MTPSESTIGSSRLLHVHDLPQLYTRPSLGVLLSTLDLLKTHGSSFAAPSSPSESRAQVDPEGVPRYLTTIVSSSLKWLESDDARDQVWEAASARLSERSGRKAAPAMTRVFEVNDKLAIRLHEPSLTEDNLGLKTWTSSLLLARRLLSLRKHLPVTRGRVLELGSGTGLVGIAAASLWNVDVLLTDLPEILPNLERNVHENQKILQLNSTHVQARILDWTNETDCARTNEDRFSVIIAADPIYSSDHPRWLVETINRWLRFSADACFILELPLRNGFEKDRSDLRQRLEQRMWVVEEGTEVGFDDWEDTDGQPVEVECWWSVWKPK